MDWTRLFNLLLAANLLGIDPLIDLLCAKVSVAIKYSYANGDDQYDHRGAFIWPGVVQELTRVFESSQMQETDTDKFDAEPSIGDLVRVQNLTGTHASSLNGQLAEVTTSIPRSSRFGVSILRFMDHQGGKQVSVKKCNLQVIRMNPKHLTNRAMSWHIGWFMETHHILR